MKGWIGNGLLNDGGLLMNEEKRIENHEIDLLDLMFYCLEKWRIVVISMLILSIVMGGYKYRVIVKENQSKQQQILLLEAEKKKKEDDQHIEDKRNVEVKEVDTQSVESYERAIEKSERILQQKEDYLDHSIIMQLDPYHVSTGTLSYYIDGGNHIDTLLSVYQTYIADGRIAKELNALNPEISVEDLRYLISFTNSANRVSELGNNQVIQTVRPGEIVFQIQIKMPNSDLCSLYLEQAAKSIAEYAKCLQTEVTQHELVLLASTQAEITDLSIEEYQSTFQSAYVASVKNLQALKSELEILLTDNAEELPGENGEEAIQTEESIPEEQKIVLADPIFSAVKSAVVGLFLGIVISCFGLASFYILSGKMQYIKDFKKEYAIPLLGFIHVLDNRKKLFGFIDTWICYLRNGVYTKIGFDEQLKMTMENVQVAIDRISAQKRVERVMLAGSIPEKGLEELCIRLSSELQGVFLSSYKQIIFHSSELRELGEYDAILFLEKKGVSYSELIIQERNLALARNMNILGAVILL